MTYFLNRIDKIYITRHFGITRKAKKEKKMSFDIPGSIISSVDGYFVCDEKCNTMFTDKKTFPFFKKDLFSSSIRKINSDMCSLKNNKTSHSKVPNINFCSCVFSSNDDCHFLYNSKINLDVYVKNTSTNNRILYFPIIFLRVCLELSPMYANGIVLSNFNPQKVIVDTKNLYVSVNDSTTNCHSGNYTLDEKNIRYSAPELFVKSCHIDNISDMWSLGIVMLEYIIGKNYVDVIGYTSKTIGHFLNTTSIFPVDQIIEICGFKNYKNTNLNCIIVLIKKILEIQPTKRIPLSFCYTYLARIMNVEYDTLSYYLTKEHESFPYDTKRGINIRAVHKKVENYHHSIHNAFELAVSICDRFCEKKDLPFDKETLIYCLYIATCFNNHYDNKYDGELSLLFFKKKLNNQMKYKITNIISCLNFELYRPTFYSYLRKKESVSVIDRNIIFIIMGTRDIFHKSNDEKYIIFNEYKKNKN
jgi:hypothetical protein